MNSFFEIAVDVLRSPSVVSGKRGDPVTLTADAKSTHLLPVSPEVASRLPNKSPSELLQSFMPGTLDIREGDIISYLGRQYPVRAVAQWNFRNKKLNHLVLEDVKTK